MRTTPRSHVFRDAAVFAKATGICLSLATLFAASMVSVQAQPLPSGCDPKLVEKSKALPYGYAARTGGYCDGSVAIDNSGELQLVSYTLGPVRFDPTGRSLSIEHTPTATSMRVVGVDKRPGADYRMDALMTGSMLSIDLTNAVTPKKITADNYGVLAWQAYGGKREFFPIVAGASQGERSDGILVLRAASAIVRATWQLCDAGGACEGQKLLGQNLLEGSLTAITLRRSESPKHRELKLNVVEPGSHSSTIIISVLTP